MAGAFKEIQYNEDDTFTFIINFKDTSGNAIDKTGKTYDFLIKTTENDVSSLVSATDVSPSDAENGEVTITIDATTMGALLEGTYKYALKEKEGSTIYTKMYGDFKVNNTA
jgi:hypothetical protein